jgi:hypothetical protein
MSSDIIFKGRNNKTDNNIPRDISYNTMTSKGGVAIPRDTSNNSVSSSADKKSSAVDHVLDKQFL